MAHGDHLKYSGKPKAGKKTFLRLISYVACDRRLLIVIGVLIVISIAANLTGSYMLRPIINDYILPGDFQGLVRILLFLAAIYLTGVAATYIEYILLNKIGQRTVTRMREELFGKMERLPVRYFDTHQHGDVMSRYTNDIDRISDALTDSLSDMLSSALTVIGIFCLMIFISPILTAVTLITVPLMFLSAKGIVKRSRKYFKAQQEALGMMNGYAEEMISGQKVVKVFGHEQKVETDFGILNQSLKDKSLKAQFYSGLMMPVMQNLNTLNYVIITIVGALLAIFRGFDVGGLAAFLQYSRQFGRPINELASLYNIEYILLNKIGQRTVTRMREELFGKMERLPVRYFDTHQHGDVMSRYTNDIDRISDALTDSLSDMLSSALTVIGIFCLMIFISPILTAVTLITVPLMFLSAKGIVKRSRKYFKAQQEALGMMNGYAEEMISGQKVVKVFGHEQKVETDFGILNQSLKDKSLKAQFYSGLMMPVMQNLNTLNYVIITIVGALLAIFRGFDVGGLAAFLQYSRQFGRPINELASLYNSIQAAIAGAERIFEIIDEAPEKADVPEAVTLKNIKGDVALKNVYFGYRPEKTILKGVSLHAPAGKKIALVGATGAGKTTILNLLPRFFDIQSGEITIDNHPIDRIERNSLRRSMAIVLQDTHLFTGTVRENIRFGRLSATDDEVVAAARLTAAHSFIKRLPQGYDTLLENDGANLSQGQRQLLNIARAAVADPAILLLDEATSNIDTRSEILIQRGLDQLMQGRTSLIIAHRLSTIRNADTILVLEHGEIIEQGSHQELLALKGKYYSLNEEQFK